jgi:hypothetical protein
MQPIYMSNSIYPAFVDDEDFPLLNRYTWHVDPKGYVVTSLFGTTVRLHRFILNAPKNMQVDHINGDKLNNTKTNLRLATNTQNQQNVPKTPRQTSSKFKGVHSRKDREHRKDKWVARIAVNGKRLHLGYFNSETEAALAYNEAAVKYFGEFANLNKL